MPKAGQIGASFVLVGVVLMAQGCGDDDRLILLGEGGCRTADNGPGAHETFKLSFDECKARCLDQGERCTAIEYSADARTCEVHSEPITKFEKAEGVACYVTRD